MPLSRTSFLAVLVASVVMVALPGGPASATGADYWHSCRPPSSLPIGTLQAHHVGCAKARMIISGFYGKAQEEGPDVFVDGFHCVGIVGGTSCRRGAQRVRLEGSSERLQHSPGATPTASAVAAEPSSTAGRRCDRPFTSTLLATGGVRVYATPKESTSQPEHREPAIAGRPVFACLKASGETRLLDLPEEGGAQHAYWVEVDPEALAVRAPFVAYAFTEYYLDSHETWIRVRNLHTDAEPRSCEAGGDIAPGRLPDVAKIVLGSDLAMAWTAKGFKGNVVRACGPAGPRLLDAGEGIDLESLALDDGVLSWTDEGTEHNARLE